jgi:flagellar assembly protein FliH
MTSSSERVIRRDTVTATSPLPTPDLRSGVWTRLGGEHARGDVVTERTLATLAESTREAARGEGYAVGWAQGMREAATAADRARAAEAAAARQAEEDRRREHAAAVQALRSAATSLQDMVGTVGRRIEEQATEVAYAVTAAVLGEAAAAQTGVDVLRRVSEALPSERAAVVRVHPSVAGTAHDLPASVSVVADARLSPADALVELDDSVVDLRVDRALARLREALR